MKNLKKALSLILAALMVLTMFACGGSEQKTTTEAAKTTTKAESKSTEAQNDETQGTELSAAEQAIADRKAKAAETGTYTKIVHALFTWTGEPTGMVRVQEAMNVILRDQLGIEVELIMMDAASYRQNLRLMLTSGTEQIDWFMGTSLGYSTAVNDGFLYDLEQDDLLATYGAGIVDMIDKVYLDACRFAGGLYGLPPMKDYAIEAGCFMIGKQYLDGIGYQYTEVDNEVKSSWEEVENIFDQLHAKYPEKYVYAIIANQIGQGTSVDSIGGDSYGVLIDIENGREVVDLFSSDLYMEMCQRMYRWNQKGFISQDALTDSTAASARIRAGNHMAYMSQSKPGYKTQVLAEAGEEMILFICGDNVIKSTGCNNTLASMNQGTEDPIAAMQYMEALYCNADLANLIVWGEEGKDYVLTDDGHITFADGLDASTAEYYHTMNWELPNQYAAHSWVGDPLNLGEVTMSFNNGAKKSIALGFTFDNSEYLAELTALNNVSDQYQKGLLLGFVDPETGIPEFVNALKDAGLEKYIAAKQAAYDEWLEINGK